MPNEFVKVAQTTEILSGDMKLVEIGEERILLTNIDGTYHAVSESCTHAYYGLSDGTLDGEEVECPLHGSLFNVKSGEVVTPPATEPLAVYATKVDGTDILIGPCL